MNKITFQAREIITNFEPISGVLKYVRDSERPVLVIFDSFINREIELEEKVTDIEACIGSQVSVDKSGLTLLN